MAGMGIEAPLENWRTAPEFARFPKAATTDRRIFGVNVYDAMRNPFGHRTKYWRH
jgi:hypothetical protein